MILAFVALRASFASSLLSVDIDRSHGSYTVSVGGSVWLESAPVRYLQSSALHLMSVTDTAGSDVHGGYQSVCMRWAESSNPNSPLVFETAIKSFDSGAYNGTLLKFEQTWLLGMNASKAATPLPPSPPASASAPSPAPLEQSRVLASFPSFVIPPTKNTGGEMVSTAGAGAPEEDLNYLSWGGCQIESSVIGRFRRSASSNNSTEWRSAETLTADATQGAPLLLYNRANTLGLVLSPLTHFHVGIHSTSGPQYQYKHNKGGTNSSTKIRVLEAGIKASVHEIPPRFTHVTVAHAAAGGVAEAAGGWGSVLLAAGNKRRYRPPRSFPAEEEEDWVLGHLGYWTDNGAYYYRSNGSFPTSEAALLAVQADAEARGIPVRYAQWDDWWYKQAGGDKLGLLEWQPPPSVFPSGLSDWLKPWNTSLYMAMYNAHNVYMPSPAPSPYDYEWAVDAATNHSLPIDVRFYRDLFKNGSRAGMRMFEQDFLCTHNTDTSLTNADVDTGDRWLRAMDTAAVEAGVTVQFCMANTAHVMASTALASVTNARGTADHIRSSASRGLALGLSSLLLWAVGLSVSRDNSWSNSSVRYATRERCLQKLECDEPSPEAQTLLAVLAGGPYGVADAVGAMNKSLVLRSCRDDGVLLKAERPLLPVRSTWARSFDSADGSGSGRGVIHVWSTQSTLLWTPLTLTLPVPVPSVSAAAAPATTATAAAASEIAMEAAAAAPTPRPPPPPPLPAAAATAMVKFGYIVGVQQSRPYPITASDLFIPTPPAPAPALVSASTPASSHANDGASARYVVYDYWHGLKMASATAGANGGANGGAGGAGGADAADTTTTTTAAGVGLLAPLGADDGGGSGSWSLPASPPSFNPRVLHHQYFVAAPVLPASSPPATPPSPAEASPPASGSVAGWCFLGEPGKFVVASARRVVAVASGSGSGGGAALATVSVTLRAAEGERVTLAFAPPSTVAKLWARYNSTTSTSGQSWNGDSGDEESEEHHHHHHEQQKQQQPLALALPIVFATCGHHKDHGGVGVGGDGGARVQWSAGGVYAHVGASEDTEYEVRVICSEGQGHPAQCTCD